MAGFGAISFGLVLVILVTIVSALHNGTRAHTPAEGPLSHSPTSQPKPGAFASLAKMIIDIPMGVVEAFKDGAQVIESVIVTLMRGLF
ncbi:hypothetical protein CASFOL_043127 [Castilleja foliolosa]|uniref:Uncharacterized protein n=1 Tax=Castilleja foliolosa TaxID=1961234 RepID=A0ABD3B7Z4_9LAMI